MEFVTGFQDRFVGLVVNALQLSRIEACAFAFPWFGIDLRHV